MVARKKKQSTGYLVGYARVSTEDQNLDLQVEALRRAGVKEDNLHIEKRSAASKKRPALDLAIMDLREGDTLLVWRLDRFARSVRDLYARLDKVYAKGARFRSLTENFDFDTFTGKFILGILGLVAELERQIIAHRTRAGIETWKEKTGQDWGRLPKLSEADIVQAGVMLNRRKNQRSGPEVAKYFKVSTATIYQHWKLNRTGKGSRFIRKMQSQ